MSEQTWIVKSEERGTAKEFESRSAAEQALEEAEALGVEAEIEGPEWTDGGKLELTDPNEGEQVATFDQMTLDQDPLDVLPGWMIDKVERGTELKPHLKKRGCQVIASYLNLSVETEAIERAAETEFEYATFRANVETPDGRKFTGHGTARADGNDLNKDDAWQLNMQAETRAYKRGIKNATAGGMDGFVKESHNE